MPATTTPISQRCTQLSTLIELLLIVVFPNRCDMRDGQAQLCSSIDKCTYHVPCDTHHRSRRRQRLRSGHSDSLPSSSSLPSTFAWPRLRIVARNFAPNSIKACDNAKDASVLRFIRMGCQRHRLVSLKIAVRLDGRQFDSQQKTLDQRRIRIRLYCTMCINNVRTQNWHYQTSAKTNPPPIRHT